MNTVRSGNLTWDKTKTNNGLVVTVERNRRIAASADRVFATLSDPQTLAGLLPRVKKVEVLHRGASSARVATHMAMGPFATIRSEGDVRWKQDQEVVFTSRHPVTVESHWSFVPEGKGTDLRVKLTIDLAPMLGPLAAMVPADQVASMIGPDLDQALSALARRIEGSGVRG
ncbi:MULTISPECIES: SRPBCC family protein [Roseiflexus]|uniref:Cyclase/dehydrase n=1 Tax=Roseiflexus castenholzii (strain DSM 13941 / HLO8) TaxID=383372 RepID=A7NK96_ROSCS|nr:MULTISPECIES: SRPBCC family protein [Roseiflexus]ABU57916.1 cyclase/dehydrase [Roseiflexus castenholzii DSM 13941]GIW00814.1 MAG: cyclase [Roseiflexus sp.]